ncbi:hypothetical protein BKA65DRAFT_589817 [Rhexocercosporidium sp. MPI-PUGE-AT-0058]|nr:hypothetical protein BKA65DRAFT_589817 [Rhexocercosporidium sp. MPI-PUGE-AT-0058]
MGNEKKPSKDRKGSQRSPRTSPKKGNFVPQPLSIRKMSASRGHGQDLRVRNTIPSDHGSDDYDEVGFSRTEIAMAMAGEQIYEHGDAVHSTLENRLSEENDSNSDPKISQYLEHSRWTTPPASPKFSMSPLLPVSLQFENKRIRYLERTLKYIDVAQLVRYDKEFHDLMWDLEGIREWWTANRVEWITNRDKLHSSQVTLNSLITQMKAAESSKSWDQHLRLKNACIQQRKEVQYKETWFPEYKYLMKLVMVQFNRVQREAQKLDAIMSQMAVVRKWVAPDGFSFGTAPPEDMDMFQAQ